MVIISTFLLQNLFFPMRGLYFPYLYKAAIFYRRVSWKLNTETRQTHDLNIRHNVCNKHYTLSRVRVAAGSDLQLWDVLDFKRSETMETPILNFATKLFVLFLPYTGKHHENPLYETVLHTHEKRNVYYTILHRFCTDGSLNWTLCLRPKSHPYTQRLDWPCVNHAAALHLLRIIGNMQTRTSRSSE